MPDTEPMQPEERTADWIVLDLLIDANEQRPWSVGELVRAVGEPVAVADAIDSLHAAGLIHRTSDDFVFITRAALRYSQIAR